MRVQIHNGQNDVAAVVGGFAVGDQLVVVHAMKFQIAIGLQRGIFAADLVHAGDQIFQAVRRGQIPALDFIFFGIEIFLAARLARRIFAKLERRAVNAVARAERRRENEADRECRATTGLQKLGEDVGRVRPKIRVEKFGDGRLCQLCEVAFQFVLRVSPRKIIVGLREAEFREAIHRLGARESLGEKNKPRIFRFQFPDAPFQKRKRFRVRIVHAENIHALFDPKIKNTF